MRLNLILFLSIFYLSSCSQVPGASQLYDAVKPLFGSKKAFMTQENISKLPYAAVSAKIGDGPEAMLILGRMDGENHHYFAQDKAVIILKKGRITRTYGLPANLWYTGFQTQDLFAQGLQHLKGPTEERRIIDLDRDGLQQINLCATFTAEGMECLNIYGRDYPLLRVRECVAVPHLKWHYQNIHWVLPQNGLVMKSIQHIHPDLSPVEITVLRPAG